MATNTCTSNTRQPTSGMTGHRSAQPTVTEFRFDDDGALVDIEPDFGVPPESDIDLRTPGENDTIEHLVRLASGDVVTVVGANAYQPEGPMTTFFSTGSSRGTIDSWSVRIASYRTNDIVSIQRHTTASDESVERRPTLVAV